jgi:hypothetical protein
MKPLNLDNRPCSPISSNCVIWQGPDIPCIKLCTGDTISDVIFKLATELCTIMDTLDIKNYDLSCFNLAACPPADFQALIQFLIEQICSSESIATTRSSPVSISNCPDCVVTVASCFIVGSQSTMQLVDYVLMIGNRICSIITDITQLQNQIDNINIRVTALEDAVPPSFTLPSISTGCLGPYMSGTPASATIDLVLNAMLNNATIGYCQLIGATGLPSEITSAVLSQCIFDTSVSLEFSPATFEAAYAGSWVQAGDLNSAADAINNIWISICDIYNYVSGLVLATSVVDAGVGTAVTSATVGTVTTYTVSTLSFTWVGQSVLPNIPKLTPGWGTGRLCDGANIIMTNVLYNEDSGYNPTLGIWSCPTTGMYRLDFVISLTAPSPDGWLDAVPGMIIAGLTTPTACDFYVVNNFTPNVISKHATISGSATTYMVAGNEVCLKIANLTNIDYVSTAGDSVKMSIERVR